MDLDQPHYQAPDYFPVACPIVSLPPKHRDAVVNAMVFMHQNTYKGKAKIIRKRTGFPNKLPYPEFKGRFNIICATALAKPKNDRAAAQCVMDMVKLDKEE